VFKRESMSVPAMRQVLGDTLRRLGVNEECVDDILLAASEACANVIRHAAHSVAEYEVATTVDTTGCRVEVIDSGGAWRLPPSRPVAPMAESGRGFEVMRACVDDVRLHSAPGRGTVLTLNKRLNWE
jgi:serine/threonine-protein kinase RsbW